LKSNRSCEQPFILLVSVGFVQFSRFLPPYIFGSLSAVSIWRVV